MGTNFNWKKNAFIPVELLPKKLQGFAQRVQDYVNDPDFDDELVQVHIGKRSSAGYYCFDCGTTLCTAGDREIHYDAAPYKWADYCPSCGVGKEDENSPIKHVCSFTWTLRRHEELLKALTKPKVAMAMKLVGKEHCVENEYKEEFTAKQALAEIQTPINFQLPCSFS